MKSLFYKIKIVLFKRNQIWVSCEGENPADRETIGSNLTYYPTRGFPYYYYPYTNIDGYLSPLVAVQVMHPKGWFSNNHNYKKKINELFFIENILINIECRAWAKNIMYRGGNQQREGSVHLELMVDTL